MKSGPPSSAAASPAPPSSSSVKKDDKSQPQQQPTEDDKKLKSKSAASGTSGSASKNSSSGMNSAMGLNITNTKGTIEAPVERKKTQVVKRFFHKVRESIGITDKTELAKPLTDSFAMLDAYKLSLDSMAESLCEVIQGNPGSRIAGDPRMELAPPSGQEEYELVHSQLTSVKPFEDYPNYKESVEAFRRMGCERRDYLRRARRALHNIRSFMKHDYWVIGLARSDLEKLRQDMDFAKEELKAAKEAPVIEVKSTIYNQATQAFEEKLKEVTILMDSVPRHKDNHIKDLLELLGVISLYHDRMAKAIEGAAISVLPSPTKKT